MVERANTGIEGLDENLEGGLPESSVTLVTGGPGSGKTTFCTQFVRSGLDEGENCLYITTGQKPEDIKESAKDFDMDIESENLSMTHVSPSNDVASNITENIISEEFDRIVLDSLSVFEMHWGEKDHLRKYINKLIEHLRDIDATVVITSERPDNREGELSRFGIAEFVVDGVILLRGFALGEAAYRTAQVVKMRRTEINGEILSLKLDKEGLRMEKEDMI